MRRFIALTLLGGLATLAGHAVVSLPEMRRGGVALCQSTLAARADRMLLLRDGCVAASAVESAWGAAA